MNYCILGRRGFIGSALAGKLKTLGHSVTSNPTPEMDVLVHLASPTHPAFDQNPSYHMTEQFTSFNYLLPYCKELGVPFVYASSALVYEPEKKSSFRHCKMALEQIAEGYGGETLGLRIFPVYGPGEETTAITQWCRQMSIDKAPVIYGDGTQKRDFIFITDVVDNIIRLIENRNTGIVDLAGGHPTSFNQIVEMINEELSTDIKPIYQPSPMGYSQGVETSSPVPTKVSLRNGIQRILES